MIFVSTSAWATPRTRARWKFTGRRRQRDGKLPAVDRIYTIEEGKGITGALCAGKPCAAEIKSGAASGTAAAVR